MLENSTKHNYKKPVQFIDLHSMTIFNAISVFFDNTVIWLFTVHRNLYAGLSRIWASLFFSKFFCLMRRAEASALFIFFKKLTKQHRKRSNIYSIIKLAITITILLIYLLVRAIENT